MAFAAGDKLGPYEILVPIGAGGMGEVYRAKDTKLKRDVALKVLPEVFASDPERMARFRREAEVLAALNHLNIAQIYGVAESGNARPLVMELVEGETLSPTFHIGTPKMLFEPPDATLAFDASPDGKRFLITQPAEAPQQSSVMKQKPTS